MTGKLQKTKADQEEFKKAVALTPEERARIMDETVIEVHTANEELLTEYKMPISSFRGMYLVHALFTQIDKMVGEKCEKLLTEKMTKFLEQEKLKKRF